jgi:hypothetical protein
MLTLTVKPEDHARQLRARRYAQGVLVVLILLALFMVIRGDWLGFLVLPLAAWLVALWPSVPTPAREAAVAVAAEPSGKGVRKLAKRVLPLWSKQLDLLGKEMREGADKLMGDFTELMSQQELMERALNEPGVDTATAILAAQRSNELCEASLHELQMFDRVGQMLDVVCADQNRLAEQIEQMGEVDDSVIESWLAHLKSTYTTEEQVAVHRGERAVQRDGGVQFF